MKTNLFGFVIVLTYLAIHSVFCNKINFLKNCASLVLVPQDYRIKRNANEQELPVTRNRNKYKRLEHSVKIQSDIKFRYATTLVTSSVINPETRSREVFLSVVLPETAFISRFAIKVSGRLFVASVKEKHSAWRQYQSAVKNGTFAGHVGISARDSNLFRVSVNTKASSMVTFYLLYEELLQRRLEQYDHVINLTPRQRLSAFSIDITIEENRNLSNLNIKGLRGQEINAYVKEPKNNTAVKRFGNIAQIKYRPEIELLHIFLRSNHALKYIISYDVIRKEASEIEVIDGYFVHFVAPQNLIIMPKHIIFVLDTSGSMQGKKILQVRNAMRTMMLELRPEDKFTIISFDSEVTMWRQKTEPIVQVNNKNLNEAIAHVTSLQANGGTNINEALLQALSSVQNTQKPSIIFFLTDGHPTVGELDNKEILVRVKNNNLNARTSIIGLAFGRQADYNLLKALSLANNGFARKIYVASDAALQLEGFYDEVSSPVLDNVTFRYENDVKNSYMLTSTNFHTYNAGSEMVVAGKLPHSSKALNLQYSIKGRKLDGEYIKSGSYKNNYTLNREEISLGTTFDELFPQKTTRHSNRLERIWAYLTIQDLLKALSRGETKSCEEPTTHQESRKKRHIESTKDKTDTKDKDDFTTLMEQIGDQSIVICDNLVKALYISLKYEFVTPLTSMVVVRPDEEDSIQNLENIKIRSSIYSRSQSAQKNPSSHSLKVVFLIIIVHISMT